MPDALDLLHADHQAVAELFTTIGKTADKAKRRELVNTVIKELSVHASVEEEVFYPAVARAVPLGREFTSVSLEEHRKAKVQLHKLEDLSPEDPMFDPAVGELAKEVKEHIADEEMQLFPRVRAHMSGDALADLATRIEDRKGTAPTRPHPKGPAKPPANVVANRAAAALDRARDAGRPGT